MKHCIDCANYDRDTAICDRPVPIPESPVTGKTTRILCRFAALERGKAPLLQRLAGINLNCGPDARYFQRKADETKGADHE